MDFKLAWNEARQELGYSGYYAEDMEEYEEIKELAIEKMRDERNQTSIFRKKNGIYRYIPNHDKYIILSRQKWKCNFCGCTLRYSKDSSWEGEIAHIDHIHPYSKRDSYIHGADKINEIENLQGLCQKCNINKTDREIN